jgi:hypothetical protein
MFETRSLILAAVVASSFDGIKGSTLEEICRINRTAMISKTANKLWIA